MFASSKCILLVFTLQISFANGMMLMRRLPHGYYNNNNYNYNYAGNSINESLVASYRPESQMCCSGNVFTTSANSYQKCCGSSEFDVTRQMCCDGKVHSMKIGFHCCGSEYFSVKKAKCCTSSITGNRTLLPFADDIASDPEATQSIKCCGSKLVDTRTHICCAQIRRYHTYYQPRRLARISFSSQRYSRFHHRYMPMTRPQFTVYEKKYAQTGCCKGKIYNKKEKTCPSNIGHQSDHQAYQRANRNRYIEHGRPRPSYHYPMFGICNRTTYNVKTHICCFLTRRNDTSLHSTSESKVVAAKSSRTSCCGLQPYDWDKEICCDNKQIHPQNPEGTMECCGLTVYDTSSKRCCESSDAVEDVDKLPDNADSCCGENKIPFDSDAQMCCGNKVFDIPKDIHGPRYFCCWDEKSGQQPSIYDPRNQVCCGGVKHDNSGHRAGCCGSETVDWHSEVCCNGKKMKRESRYESCCGNTTFNSRHELCCNYETGFVLPRKSRGDSCCGNVTYDYREQLCCRSDFSLLGSGSGSRGGSTGETAVFFRATRSVICCNLTAIDSRTHACCDGKAIVKSEQLCCRSMDSDGLFDSVTLLDKVTNKSRCCGKEQYDPDSHKCCDNTVVEVGDRSLRCCGSQVYHPARQTCCADKVYDSSRENFILNLFHISIPQTQNVDFPVFSTFQTIWLQLNWKQKTTRITDSNNASCVNNHYYGMILNKRPTVENGIRERPAWLSLIALMFSRKVLMTAAKLKKKRKEKMLRRYLFREFSRRMSKSTVKCVIYTRIPSKEVVFNERNWFANRNRPFHTSPQRFIPPIVLLILRPVSKLASIIVGRSIRVWWRKLTPEKKLYYWEQLEINKKRVYGDYNRSAAFAVILLCLFYLSHIEETPITKRKRFVLFSPDQFDSISEEMYGLHVKMHQNRILPPNHNAYAFVKRVTDKLVQGNADIPQMHRHPWSITIINDPTFNSFVLPSGQIFVFTGMLRICSNEDQLGAVLGHEMAHAVLGHTAELVSYLHILDMIMMVVATAIWALLPTDISSIVVHWITARMKKLIFELPYSRMLESEADYVGLFMAAKSCFDVRECSAFWSKMEALRKLKLELSVEFLSTHPSHETRAITLDKLMNKAIETRLEAHCPVLRARDPRNEIENFRQWAEKEQKRQLAEIDAILFTLMSFLLFSQPAIAVGNVGQLSVDLLLSTVDDCVKIGCFYDKSLLFLVGNDPYNPTEEGQCRLATGMDVYENVEKKLVLIQQRVPVVQNRTNEFRKILIDWIKSKSFQRVILLSSCSTHARTDSQLRIGCQFRFLTTPKFEKTADLERQFHWKRLELRENLTSNQSSELYVPGGGLTKRIYQDCCKDDVDLAVLLLFCSEGDNKPEALTLASYLNEWLNLVEVPKNIHPHSVWKIPPSWKHLFGNAAPLTMY
uniref:Uncharacterized protein n=1 Tax=Strigamia maritima TaxID=126957 RepID=T1JGZ0_STRMM